MAKHLLLILLPILLTVVVGCKKQTNSASEETPQQLPVIDLIRNMNNIVQSLPFIVEEDKPILFIATLK